jgi:hypothetical protein
MRASKESPFILVGKSTIHGTGVFARKRIPQRTRIIEYTGDVLNRKESLKRDKAQKLAGKFYMFAIDKKRCVDGSTGGDAKFINHGCAPNCFYHRSGSHIWIYALRDIRKGEELTYDYKISEKGKYVCLCDAENCNAFM